MDYSVIPLHDIPALIEWLDTLYPDKCPDPKHTEREIWMKAGERRLVNTLISKLNATETKVLKGDS